MPRLEAVLTIRLDHDMRSIIMTVTKEVGGALDTESRVPCHPVQSNC